MRRVATKVEREMSPASFFSARYLYRCFFLGGVGERRRSFGKHTCEPHTERSPSVVKVISAGDKIRQIG